MIRFILLISLLILANSYLPAMADDNSDNFEEYKCDLMMKGYEFTNDGLSEAIIKNDTEAVELFVKADININLPDNEGYSALDRAIKENDKELENLLTKAGGETKLLKNVATDVEPADTEQSETTASKNPLTENTTVETPATEAPVAQQTVEAEFVKTETAAQDELIESKTDFPVIKSEIFDENALSSEENSDISIDKNLLAIAQKAPVKSQNLSAEQKKQQIVEAFCDLINTDNAAEVAKVAKNFFGINIMTKEGLAPLHYAVFNDNAEIVKILLDNGADVNKKTSDGLTSLDIAVLNNQLAIIKMLLSQGGALSGQVATELKKLGCQSNLDPTTNLYDTTLDDLLPVLKKIQSTLDNQ